VANNADSVRYRAVPAVDSWDAIGKMHDLGLAEASGPLARFGQDLKYAALAGLDGYATGNKLEMLSALAVPFRGLT